MDKVVTGMGLRSMWGMPMFNLSGLLLLALLPGRFDPPDHPRNRMSGFGFHRRESTYSPAAPER